MRKLIALTVLVFSSMVGGVQAQPEPQDPPVGTAACAESWLAWSLYEREVMTVPASNYNTTNWNARQATANAAQAKRDQVTVVCWSYTPPINFPVAFSELNGSCYAWATSSAEEYTPGYEKMQAAIVLWAAGDTLWNSAASDYNEGVDYAQYPNTQGIAANRFLSACALSSQAFTKYREAWEKFDESTAHYITSKDWAQQIVGALTAWLAVWE